jgi:hypothetical protein
MTTVSDLSLAQRVYHPYYPNPFPNVGITNAVPDSRTQLMAFIFSERAQELFKSRTAMGFSGRS